MTIGVLKESLPETRVSLLPEHISILKKLNSNVLVEIDAGQSAFAANNKYEEAGAKIVSRNEILTNSDIITAVNIPEITNAEVLQSKILIGNFQPLYNYTAIYIKPYRTVKQYIYCYFEARDGSLMINL